MSTIAWWASLDRQCEVVLETSGHPPDNYHSESGQCETRGISGIHRRGGFLALSLIGRNPKDFSGATQLVHMALETVQAERSLFALPTEPGLPQLFGSDYPGSDFLYHDYTIYRHDLLHSFPATAGRVGLHFAARLDSGSPLHDVAVVYLPKGKELIRFVFSAVSDALEPSARVLIVGDKRSSIRSINSVIRTYFGDPLSSRYGRHCVLIEARRAAAPMPFDGRKSYVVKWSRTEFGVVTLPGVFSYGKLDSGTKFLLENLLTSGLEFQSALDCGCGGGVIGTALKLIHPSRDIEFVDSNIMALESTRETLRRNDLEDCHVYPSDVFSDVRGQYDLIVSNPPYHTGLATDYSVTERLVGEANRYLTKSGRLMIVTNAFSKYASHLRNSFREVEMVARRRQYRVIVAHGG